MNLWDACQKVAVERLKLPVGYAICSLELTPHSGEPWEDARVTVGYPVLIPGRKRTTYVRKQTTHLRPADLEGLL